MGVSITTVQALRESAHDAVHLRDVGLISLPDRDIVAKAAREQSVVLTFDLGFGDILAVGRAETPRVIIFRLRNQTPAALNPRLFRVIAEGESELATGAIIIVKDQDIGSGDYRFDTKVQWLQPTFGSNHARLSLRTRNRQFRKTATQPAASSGSRRFKAEISIWRNRPRLTGLGRGTDWRAVGSPVGPREPRQTRYRLKPRSAVGKWSCEDWVVGRRVSVIRPDMYGSKALRRGTSRGARRRQFPGRDRRCREPQALADVFRPEVGILSGDVVLGKPAGQQSQDCGDRNPKVSDAWDAAHLRGINRDALKIRHGQLTVCSRRLAADM